TGSALFTQDVKLPGMLTAVVLHPPRFGAKLARFDAAKAKEIRGVLDVVAFSTPATNGVAVLAKTTGRPSEAATHSSPSGTRPPPSGSARRRSSPSTSALR